MVFLEHRPVENRSQLFSYSKYFIVRKRQLQVSQSSHQHLKVLVKNSGEKMISLGCNKYRTNDRAPNLSKKNSVQKKILRVQNVSIE
jgi:hypothetical protein